MHIREQGDFGKRSSRPQYSGDLDGTIKQSLESNSVDYMRDIKQLPSH